SRVAEAENTSGKLDRRREILASVNRQLFMPPPSDAPLPQPSDFLTLLSSRVATGEISLNWVAYLYTTYQRDMVEHRPTGTPRRSIDQAHPRPHRLVPSHPSPNRPDQDGIKVGDILGTGDDTISLDEIESGK